MLCLATTETTLVNHRYVTSDTHAAEIHACIDDPTSDHGAWKNMIERLQSCSVRMALHTTGRPICKHFSKHERCRLRGREIVEASEKNIHVYNHTSISKSTVFAAWKISREGKLPILFSTDTCVHCLARPSYDSHSRCAPRP